MWVVYTNHFPVIGQVTTLYCPAGCPRAYAAGADDARLARIAARLNHCACGQRDVMPGYGECSMCRDAWLRDGGAEALS